MSQDNNEQVPQAAEIEPLEDETLEDVAGGACSGSWCSHLDAAQSENP